ncbi:DUF1127 domain-containing protein [Pseudomonas sp. Marseille-QA0892]
MQRVSEIAQYNDSFIASPSAQGILSTLAVWQRRIVSRHQLARLDARLLADAGISEADRAAELRKPFWR